MENETYYLSAGDNTAQSLDKTLLNNSKWLTLVLIALSKAFGFTCSGNTSITFFIITIALVMLSMRLSQICCYATYRQKNCDNQLRFLSFLNWAVIITFIVGIISFAFFIKNTSLENLRMVNQTITKPAKEEEHRSIEPQPIPTPRRIVLPNDPPQPTTQPTTKPKGT